jgi:hypothetical protein
MIILCVYCGNIATSVDHIIPRSKGGENIESNIVPCCQTCNSEKHDRLLTEWNAHKVLHAVAVEPKVYDALKSLPPWPLTQRVQLKVNYITQLIDNLPPTLPTVIYETVLTIKQLVDNRVIDMSYAALKKAAYRDVNFPLPVRPGQPRLYRPGDVRQWHITRRTRIGVIIP